MHANDESLMPSVLVVAHDVELPIKDHRRQEFRDRIVHMSKEFDLTVVSVDRFPHGQSNENDFRLVRLERSQGSIYVRLAEIIRTSKPDIVFCDGFEEALWAVLAMMLHRCKWILLAQTYVGELFFLDIRDRLKSRVFPGVAERVADILLASPLMFCDSAIFVSETMRRNYRWAKKYGRLRGEMVVSHSLDYLKNIDELGPLTNEDQTLLRSIVDDEHIHLAAVGGLIPLKRIDVAIRAQAVLRERGIPSKLHMFGDGPEAGNLKCLTQELGVEGSVSFEGTVGKRCLLQALARMDALLFTAVSDGLSVTVCDAMGLGCPVVAYANNGMRELAGYDMPMLLAYSDSPVEYADAVTLLLSRPDLRAEMTEAARILVAPMMAVESRTRSAQICQFLRETLDRE